jgi:hypothetical protein
MRHLVVGGIADYSALLFTAGISLSRLSIASVINLLNPAERGASRYCAQLH